MEPLEIVARGSVWLALAAYPAGPLAIGGVPAEREPLLRSLWTAGAAAFLVHAATSFAVFYDGSHAVALVETARQTAEMTGRSTAVGLWLNYLFATLWLADAAEWQIAPERRRRRPPWLDRSLHAFLLFMIVNGAVVFVEGPRRLLGVLLTGAAIAAWLVAERRIARGAGP